MKRLPELLLFIVPFTILHAACSFVAGFFAYGEYRSPNAKTYEVIATVLMSPMRLLPHGVLESLGFGFLPINSLIRAICIATIWTLLLRRPARRGFPVGPPSQTGGGSSP